MTKAADNTLDYWQPIETAPKDGRRILVCCAADDLFVVAQWRIDDWITCWDHTSPSSFDYQVTHWMPLPGLPND
jgi:hypothetical protein